MKYEKIVNKSVDKITSYENDTEVRGTQQLLIDLIYILHKNGELKEKNLKTLFKKYI